MQERQPTHFVLSMQTRPLSMCKAPEIQHFTHKGSSQWRQETAKLILSLPSTEILGKSFLPFSAFTISDNPELAKAQLYSHKWQPRHHSSFTYTRFIQSPLILRHEIYLGSQVLCLLVQYHEASNGYPLMLQWN